MARKYSRDNRGRFASAGAGATARGGRLKTASGGKRATQTRQMTAAPRAGTVRKGSKTSQAMASPKPIKAKNTIKSFNREKKLPSNNIKPYNAATIGGKFKQIDRRIDTSLKDVTNSINSFNDRIKKVQPKLDKTRRRFERSNAKAIADRFSKNPADRLIAQVEMGTIGSRYGAKAIRRRMERATAAAEKGSRPAAKAREIYGNQLAFTGPGKPSRGKNNLRPGPRNTGGAPKKRRRNRKG
jgi:hypothetical protein